MMSYSLMSTPSCSASCCALPAGRTWKPTMMALPARARLTSDSVMPPTPAEITSTLTCSVASAVSDDLSASAEPCTSALRTTLSSLTAPSLMRSRMFSSDTLVLPASSFLRRESRRWSTSSLACFSSADGVERLARLGHARQAQHLDRRRRGDLGQVATLVVEHRAHLADELAGDDGVADLQGAVLHQHRRHRTAVAVELGFDDGAARGLVRVGLELEQLRLQRRSSASSCSMPTLVRADTST